MIRSEVEAQLRPPLDDALPGFFEGRTYVRQRSHVRMVRLAQDEMVGQVALDYRVIPIGADVVPICGVVDLCVRNDCRGLGLGSQLLIEAEAQARQTNACFMVPMAGNHDFYRRHGFFRIQGVTTKWLAIEDRSSHSLTEQDLSDQLMAKQLTEMTWPKGSIDLLGYLF